MSKHADADAAGRILDDFNMVGSAGGARAILGVAGAILACHQAGICRWRTCGGASGGSIPTVLLAQGMHPVKIVRMAIELDFADLVTRHASWHKVLLAFFMKDRYEKTRPRLGILSSEQLGAFVDSQVGQWPCYDPCRNSADYWTVATVGHKQWLFTADGVFEYTKDSLVRISDKPAPVGLAVRASCSVPGIMDSVPFPVGDKVLYLSDGAFGIDGRCPVGVVKRHFTQPAGRIIACDVGAEQASRKQMWIRRLWKLFCHDCLLEPEGNTPRNSEGTVLIQPVVTSVRSMQFTPTHDQKWEAVMTGFLTAAVQLEIAGILIGEKLNEAKLIARKFQELPALRLPEGELSAATESLLSSRGLY